MVQLFTEKLQQITFWGKYYKSLYDRQTDRQAGRRTETDREWLERRAVEFWYNGEQKSYSENIFPYWALGKISIWKGKVICYLFHHFKTPKIFYEIGIYYRVVWTNACQRNYSYFVSRRSGGTSSVLKGQIFLISKKKRKKIIVYCIQWIKALN